MSSRSGCPPTSRPCKTRPDRQGLASACPTTRGPIIRRSCSSCARAIRATSTIGPISCKGDDIEIIIPDPKTSGNGKLTALAAWGAVVARGGSESEARDYLQGASMHAPFLVARRARRGVAFAVEKRATCSVAWENEALREVDDSKGARGDRLSARQACSPSPPSPGSTPMSQEPQRGARQSLSRIPVTDEAQAIIAPRGLPAVQRKSVAEHTQTHLPQIELFPITLIARDWTDAQQKFFAENGDHRRSLYVPSRAWT